MITQINRNEHLNGIEVKFPEIPSERHLKYLKEKGFHWNPRKMLWHIYYSPEILTEVTEFFSDMPLPKEPEKAQKAQKQDTRIVKFRTLANNMQKTIDNKFNSGVSLQRPTARRLAIAEGMRHDGENLQKVQTLLRGIAKDLEKNCLPDDLQEIKSKTQLAEILFVYHHRPETLPGTLVERFQIYLNGIPARDRVEGKIRGLENQTINLRIKDFFPTPKELAEEMIDFAQVEPKMTILEPSAGKGDIADLIKKQFPDNPLSLCETSYALREILGLKGYNLAEWDFLDLSGIFDRIIMNPPFTTATEHIPHAWELLAEGGILVTLVPEGIYFRTQEKFRKTLRLIEDNMFYERAIPNAFKSAWCATGVNSRIVVLRKEG